MIIRRHVELVDVAFLTFLTAWECWEPDVELDADYRYLARLRGKLVHRREQVVPRP